MVTKYAKFAFIMLLIAKFYGSEICKIAKKANIYGGNIKGVYISCGRHA